MSLYEQIILHMFNRKGKDYCSTSGSHRGTLVKDTMISHAKGQELYYNIQNKNLYFEFSAHTRFWTYPWSSVTARILKDDRWKGKKCLGCNPPHVCVSLKPGPGWGGLICVYWFKLNCRASLFQHYFHKMARNEKNRQRYR